MSQGGSGFVNIDPANFGASSDLARTVATTASVIVGGSAGGSGAKKKPGLFGNTVFKQAMGDALGDVAGTRKLFDKHSGEARIRLLLRRRAEKARDRDQRRKDFTILSEELLNSIPDGSEAVKRGDESEKRGNETTGENGVPPATANDPSETEDLSFSLFQGFSATIPEVNEQLKRLADGSGKLLDFTANSGSLVTQGMEKADFLPYGITEEKIRTSQNSAQLSKFKYDINYRLDLLEIRKGLSCSQIDEIDRKIDRLYKQRKLVFERIASFEQNQSFLEDKLNEIEARLQLVKNVTPRSSDDVPDAKGLAEEMEDLHIDSDTTLGTRNPSDYEGEDVEFVNVESPKRSRKTSHSSSQHSSRRVSSRKHRPTLQKYYSPGDEIHSFKAHDAPVTCLDFDQPFGTMVSASQDNTVSVWDLSRYQCVGLLEGHLSNVTCLQVRDNLCLTGSLDATLRLWDVGRVGHEDAGSPLIESFESHVEEVTALSMYEDTIVSGSADKTIRQWDIETGRCLQTIDVLWATSMMNSSFMLDESPTDLLPSLGDWDDVKHPFIGALQCYDAALASGGSDGIVRLWDLRSGQVVRQLVGHTGAITCLAFDSKNIVTGSSDRSVRIWDLRTGHIVDSFAYPSPISSLQFDAGSIMCTNNENTVKLYDRVDGKHRICGAGVAEPDASTVNFARYKEGYLVEGREDGTVGAWAI